MTTELTAPGPDMPVIDENRLLSEFGDCPEILVELRDLFLEHAPVLKAGILDGLTAGDLPTVVAQAHSLKGSCATYGADRLATVCRNIELAARAGDGADAASWREDLLREYDALFAAIGDIKT